MLHDRGDSAFDVWPGVVLVYLENVIAIVVLPEIEVWKLVEVVAFLGQFEQSAQRLVERRIHAIEVVLLQDEKPIYRNWDLALENEGIITFENLFDQELAHRHLLLVGHEGQLGSELHDLVLFGDSSGQLLAKVVINLDVVG